MRVAGEKEDGIVVGLDDLLKRSATQTSADGRERCMVKNAESTATVEDVSLD